MYLIYCPDFGSSQEVQIEGVCVRNSKNYPEHCQEANGNTGGVILYKNDFPASSTLKLLFALPGTQKRIVAVTWSFVSSRRPPCVPYGGDRPTPLLDASPLKHTFLCLLLKRPLSSVQKDQDKILSVSILLLFNQSLVTNLWVLTTQQCFKPSWILRMTKLAFKGRHWLFKLSRDIANLLNRVFRSPYVCFLSFHLYCINDPSTDKPSFLCFYKQTRTYCLDKATVIYMHLIGYKQPVLFKTPR